MKTTSERVKFHNLKHFCGFFFVLHVKGVVSKLTELKVDLLWDLENVLFAGVFVHVSDRKLYRFGQ